MPVLLTFFTIGCETLMKSCAIDSRPGFLDLAKAVTKNPKIVSVTPAKWLRIGSISESYKESRWLCPVICDK